MTNSPPDGSSTRVKAFRARLADGDYRRVEGYITSVDKARVDAIKQELGTTSDTVVAGLLRLGLQSYEQLSSAPPGSAAHANAALPSGNAESVGIASARSLGLTAAANCATSRSSMTNPIERFFQRRKDATQ